MIKANIRLEKPALLETGLRVAMGVLCFTAISKLVSVAGESRVLNNPAPLLEFMTQRQLLLAAGIGEIVAVWAMIRARLSGRAYLILTTVASAFFGYRVAYHLAGYKGPCACLGTAWGWLGVSDQVVDTFATFLLAILMAVGYAGLWQTLKYRPASSASQVPSVKR